MDFQTLIRKRKGETINSTGSKPAQPAQVHAERGCACDRAVNIAKRPLVFQITGDESLATIHCLSDICNETHRLLFLRNDRSPMANADERALRRTCTGRDAQPPVL
jgi:hypothetical protein